MAKILHEWEFEGHRSWTGTNKSALEVTVDWYKARHSPRVFKSEGFEESIQMVISVVFPFHRLSRFTKPKVGSWPRDDHPVLNVQSVCDAVCVGLFVLHEDCLGPLAHPFRLDCWENAVASVRNVFQNVEQTVRMKLDAFFVRTSIFRAADEDLFCSS